MRVFAEKFFTFHKTMCSLTGIMVFPMMFNATKEVSLIFGASTRGTTASAMR